MEEHAGGVFLNNTTIVVGVARPTNGVGSDDRGFV
jgi:hypothetical protein